MKLDNAHKASTTVKIKNERFNRFLGDLVKTKRPRIKFARSIAQRFKIPCYLDITKKLLLSSFIHLFAFRTTKKRRRRRGRMQSN